MTSTVDSARLTLAKCESCSKHSTPGPNTHVLFYPCLLLKSISYRIVVRAQSSIVLVPPSHVRSSIQITLACSSRDVMSIKFSSKKSAIFKNWRVNSLIHHFNDKLLIVSNVGWVIGVGGVLPAAIISAISAVTREGGAKDMAAAQSKATLLLERWVYERI